MIPQIVQDYITARYHRWLDYAAYLFPASGADGEPLDLLNEVLCMLLEKDTTMLLNLVSTRKGIYTELDFFVLKMIRTNAFSPTSPYRCNYRRPAIDTETDFSRMELIDKSADKSMEEFVGESCLEYDRNEEILRRFTLVREVFEHLDLTKEERGVFTFRFFQDRPFTEWAGDIPQRRLYRIYERVIARIRREIEGKVLY